LQRIIVIERGNNEEVSERDIESSDIDSKIGLGQPSGDHKKNNKSNKSSKSKKQKAFVDLRHILGFLNQTEWI
jgi:hypothetical protein